MIVDDPLVSAIFDAVRKEQATPAERRLALMRAGLIAQMYEGDASTIERNFGSFRAQFHDDGDLDLSGRSRTADAGTH